MKSADSFELSDDSDCANDNSGGDLDEGIDMEDMVPAVSRDGSVDELKDAPTVLCAVRCRDLDPEEVPMDCKEDSTDNSICNTCT